MPFRDECGVFGICQQEEASRQTYLGLYALQHRGQEAAGICSGDGAGLHLHKAQGHVADVFSESILDRLPGDAASQERLPDLLETLHQLARLADT